MLYRTYNEIINLRRPISYKHPHMSNECRAAQFAPFAALTGYEAVVKEAARLTEPYRELDESEKEQIGRVLNEVLGRIKKGESPSLKLTYFKKDKKKSGGEYVTDVCKIKKIDSCTHTLLTQEGLEIKFESLLSVDFSQADF